MSFENLEIYQGSVSAANQRDLPYGENTSGDVIDFAPSSAGVLAWADDNSRRALGRLDGSGFLYYGLEVTDTNEITVTRVSTLGALATDVVAVTPGNSYDTLVDGVTIPLASSLVVGSTAKVYAGLYLLASGGLFLQRGQAGDSATMLLFNPGTEDHAQVSVCVGRGFDYSGDALESVAAVLINPIADTYAVTVSTGTSSGFKYTFTGTHNTYVSDNVAAGSTGNPVSDSAATGLTFDCPAGVSTSSTGTLHVSALADGLQLAPDNAGVPGTWVSWNNTTGLLIPANVAGRTDQRVAASESVKFYMRWNGAIDHPLGRGWARLYTASLKLEE